MIKYLIISGLIGGYLAPPAHPQSLQGGVSQTAVQADAKTDLLQSPVSQNNTNLQAEYPVIKVHVNDKKPVQSALGFHYVLQNGVIDYVDPNCDLFGSIQPGDRFLAMDGISANKALREHRNYGTEGTVMQCTFQTSQGIITLPCIRHNVDFFGPIWQRDRR